MKPFFVLAVACIAASLFVVAGSASATRTRTAPTRVTVVMRDPGCHWFSVNGAFRRTLTIKGPASLANYDMATLDVVGGPSRMIQARVGKRVTLARGTYRIVMVGQASDDNVLTLVVR